MNALLLKRFFAPIESTSSGEKIADYENLRHIMLFLEKIKDFLPQNSHIVDNHRQNFIFISRHSIFLCGYTEEEVMEMGYDFYNKILSPENLEKLAEINDAIAEFFYDIPVEKKIESSIAYNLVLRRKDGSSFCVNHKLKPFLFSENDNIWLSICCVRPSTDNEVGDVKCFFGATNKRFSYSLKEKRWKELRPLVLSEVERFVVVETDKGTLEKQQACRLGCTRSNIRYCKSMILKKTGTKTMREAILFLNWYYPELCVD